MPEFLKVAHVENINNDNCKFSRCVGCSKYNQILNETLELDEDADRYQ